MPRAYLISECADKNVNPIDGQPTYLIAEPVDWSHEFEHWYVDENYACVDDDGHRYALRWDLERGMSAEVIEGSKGLRSLFYAWLEIWITNLPPQLRRALNIPERGRDEEYLSGLLDDIDVLRRLSKRK